MAIHTINIDVVDMTIPALNNRNIPIINQPNPCYGYAANAKEVRQLIQLSNYKITEAGTNKPITGNNYYEYFPEEQPGGGGGGGVTSYSSLTGKPEIDNHTLMSGNNTSSNLGLQTKLSTVQLEAVNSGITSDDVAQIGTNENNILLNTEYGVGNVLSPYTSGNVIADLNDSSITYTISTTGKLTISKSTSVSATSYIRHTFTVDKSGTYVFTTQANSTSTTKSDAYIQDMTGTPTVVARDYGAEQVYNYTTGTTYRITCRVSDGFSGTVTFEPMLVPKSLYDAGFTDYQPYAMSNAELTVAEKQNENNISTIQQQVGYANTELEGVM